MFPKFVLDLDLKFGLTFDFVDLGVVFEIMLSHFDHLYFVPNEEESANLGLFKFSNFNNLHAY